MDFLIILLYLLLMMKYFCIAFDITYLFKVKSYLMRRVAKCNKVK